MRQVSAATQRTRSLCATLTVRMQIGNGRMDVKSGRLFLQKPNRAHIDVPLEFGAVYATVNSDGRRLWERTIGNGRSDGSREDAYRSVPADAYGKNINFYFALPVAFFFNPAAPLTTMFAVDKRADIHYVGRKKLNNVTYDVIEQAVLQPTPYTVRLYISPEKLLSRVETDMPTSIDMPRHQYFEADLSNVTINRSIAEQAFAFTPSGEVASSAYPPSHSNLPAVGTQAPDLALRDLKGKPLTLHEMLKGKKAVYLDFWFCECMGCRYEFPALQKLYSSLDGHGLAVYAVDIGDSSAKVIRYKSRMDLLKSTTFPLTIVSSRNQEKVMKDYGLDGYPAGVLVGADGKVLFTSVGYDKKVGLHELATAFNQSGRKP